MISRRTLAHGLGMETASLAKADRRGKGPGRPITISKTHVCYREEDVAAYLYVRGLEWAGGTVRPLQTKAPAATGARGDHEHEQPTTT